ncbi:MAG TPA: hypothetical protein VM432_05195 [Bdellovibrionales bacterium]|jgi:hypothetical protein|nr:hypothetical protein [Bdellovibrionales bacterium]
MKVLNILVIVSLAFFSGLANADQFGDDADHFSKVLSSIDAVPNVRIRELTPSKKLTRRFQEISESQAMIWADTILEGDYHADRKVVITSIQGIFRSKQLVAYRLTYSSKAWYTGDCDYDGEDQSTLSGCTEGNISESTFVSPTLKTWMRDDNAYAEFDY